MKILRIIGSIMGVFMLLASSIVFAERNLIPPTRMLQDAGNPNGYLSVFSEPSGLTVYLDKKKIGATPIFSMEVEPGSHVLKIKDTETELAVSQGASKHISLHKGVFLDITPDPPQAPLQEAKKMGEPRALKTTAVGKTEKQPKDPLYWPLNPEGPIE